MGILFVDQQQDYVLTHAHVNNQQDSSCNKKRRSTNVQDQSNNSGGGESGCSTVLEFWRKFDTCDVNDYMLDVSFYYHTAFHKDLHREGVCSNILD